MGAKVSLKHYLFTGRKTSGNLPIYLRITYDRKKAEVHSGYSSTIKDWNLEGQCTKSSNTINQELLKQKGKIYELLIELQNNHKPISALILKDLFTGKNKLNATIIDSLAKYIEELTIRNEIKPVSLNKYKQSLNSLRDFIT